MKEVGYYLCVMLCMFWVGEWTYHWTVSEKKRYIIAVMVYVMGYLYCFILSSRGISTFYFIEIVSWLLVSKLKFKDKIWKVLTLSLLIGIVEGMMMALITFITKDNLEMVDRKLVAIIMVILIFALITQQKWYKKTIYYLSGISKLKSMIMLGALFLNLVLVAFAYVLQMELNNSIVSKFFRALVILEVIVVIIAVIWNIMENYQKKYYMKQNELKDKCLQMQKEYYETVRLKDHEMRKFRHDVANQMGVLQLLLDYGETDKAKEQLKRMHQEFVTSSVKKIQVGEELLDAILSLMSQKAEEKGVTLDVVGNISRDYHYDVYDLCTIFMNAITNAIEARSGLDGENVVWIKLINHNDTLFCSFENEGTQEMYQAIVNERTSKTDTDNHGYGIQNIKQAVERLNGSMEYHFKEGKIKLEIYI